jgi:hypothetical protein
MVAAAYVHDGRVAGMCFDVYVFGDVRDTRVTHCLRDRFEAEFTLLELYQCCKTRDKANLP